VISTLFTLVRAIIGIPLFLGGLVLWALAAEIIGGDFNRKTAAAFKLFGDL
jgi:hypothetical protein